METIKELLERTDLSIEEKAEVIQSLIDGAFMEGQNNILESLN